MNIRRLGVLFFLLPLGFILSACGGGGGFIPTAPSITTSALPAGTVGSPYSAPITAMGGTAPYTFALVTGTLPAGLTLSAGGVVSGTPTTTGTSTFTVQVTDSEITPRTATAILSIKINGLSITTASLPSGTVGSPYSATITATGGTAPYTFTITAGTLPTGLVLAANGTISGTPTTVETSTFTVQVTDSSSPAQTATASLSIKINPTSSMLNITTTNLPAGTVGIAYTATITAVGGSTPYTFAVTTGTLPAGLSLNAGTGAITGTPTTTGTSPFTITVTDSSSPRQTASAPLSITINALQELTITTTSLPEGLVGQAYTATITATGGKQPYTFTLTSGTLPSGLTLNANGTITGMPTATGTSPFVVTVTDSSSPVQTAHANLAITVDAALAITTTTLPGGTIGTAYSATITATGGVPPYTFSITSGSLPNGLTLSSTGTISGTPTGPPNTAAFTVQVLDANTPPDAATASLTITISEPLVIVNSSLPSEVVGVIYNAELQSTGGTGDVTYAVTVGTLPPGLTLNPHGATTALISGTANTPGTFPFTITATDQSTPPKTANAALSITVGGPTILPLNLPVGTTGTAYTSQVFYSGCNEPTTWSLANGSSLPPGLTLGASNGTLTGTPTGTTQQIYHFALTALAPTCSQPTTTANLSIEITVAAAQNAELIGNYVFLSSGYNEAGGSAYYAGIFTADGNGNITGGVLDFNSYAPGNSGFNVPILTGSSYSLNSDNRGTMTIDTTTLGNITFAFTAGSLSGGISNGGTMVQFDNPDLGYITSGQFYAQAVGPFTNANLTGSYAFGFKGLEGANAPYSTAGVLTSDGNGNITSGSQDIDNAGTVSGELAITPTTYAVAANGRGTTTLTTSSGGVGYIFYIVSANNVLFAGSDPTGPTLASGPSTLQTGGPFTNASLNVSSAVDTDIYASSSSFTSGSTPGADIFLGFFTPDGNGNFTLSADENQAGNILPPPPVPIPGTYTVEANGRVALSGLSPSPVLYLSAPNTAYLVGTDSGAASGSLAPQTTVAGGYLNSTLTGFYNGVSILPEVPGTHLYSGYINANASASGLLGLVDDDNQGGGALFYGAASAQTIDTMPSGRAAVATGQITSVVYIVSPNEFISLPTYPLTAAGTLGAFSSQITPPGAPLVLQQTGTQSHNPSADSDSRP